MSIDSSDMAAQVLSVEQLPEPPLPQEKTYAAFNQSDVEVKLDEKPLHHNPAGGFQNPWTSFSTKRQNLLKMVWSLNRSNLAKPVADILLPVHTPDWEKHKAVYLDKSPSKGIATWIGHASVLYTIPHFNILFDPVFSERCSPISFAGPKRHVPPPCKIADLPTLDLVVLSHNHYDHLDLEAIKKLRDRQPGKLLFLVPLGLASWFKALGIQEVKEFDWWQQFKIERQGQHLELACTPAQHFSGRSLTDKNNTLWCSWVVKPDQGQGSRFFFTGDTGYATTCLETEPESAADVAVAISADDTTKNCPAFKQIGSRYGPFDLAAIPIGAYHPRWFMSPIHCTPYEAVHIHNDIQSRRSFGIHWGTFPMTDEHYGEPREKLITATTLLKVDSLAFQTLEIGSCIEAAPE